MSDRIYWAILSSGLSIWLLVSVIKTGEWTDFGFPHPMVIEAVLSGTAAVGLWLRKRWGRWCGMMLSVMAIALVTNHIRLHGVTLARVGTIVFSCYAIWFLWQLPITAFEEMLANITEIRKLIDDKVTKQFAGWHDGLVILEFSPPVKMTLEVIADAAERAFEKTFERRRESMDDPIDAGVMAVMEKNPVVSGSGSVFVCFDPPSLISVHLSFSDGSNPLDDLTSVEGNNSVESVALALQPTSTEQECPDNPYTWTAMMAAELVNEATTVAVVSSIDGQFDSTTGDIAAELRALAESGIDDVPDS